MIKSLITALALAWGMITHAQTTTNKVVLSDAQVAQVLVTLNEAEIDAAKKAQVYSRDSAVKNFASLITTDHDTNKKEVRDLAARNSFSMKTSDVNRTLKADVSSFYVDLEKASPADFDRTYIDQQIDLHETALDLIDTTLIPNTKNSDLMSHLQKTRTAINSHLSEARSIQSKLR